MGRRVYKVVYVSPEGRNRAVDESDEEPRYEFDFHYQSDAIDIGDVISAVVGQQDPTFLADVAIEVGRNAVDRTPKPKPSPTPKSRELIAPHLVNQDAIFRLSSEGKRRMEWARDYMNDLKRNGIIESWNWAENETAYHTPLTNPLLSEDQLAVMEAAYTKYQKSLP